MHLHPRVSGKVTKLFVDELKQLLAFRRFKLLEIDGAVVVRVGGSGLGFLQIDGPVVVGIECLERRGAVGGLD